MENISVPLFSENSAYANSNYIISKLQEVLMETETIWDFIPLPIDLYDSMKNDNQFIGFVFDLNVSPAYMVLIYNNDKSLPNIRLKVLVNKTEQTAKTKKHIINQIEFILDDVERKSSDIISL